MQAQLEVQHSVMTSPTAVLVLEIYQWQTLSATPAQLDLPASAVASPTPTGSVKASGLKSNPSQALSQLPKDPMTSARASTSSASSSKNRRQTGRQSPEGDSDSQSDAESDSSSTASGRASKPSSGAMLVPFGVARFPLRHIPEDRSGVIAELEGVIMRGVRGRIARGLQDGCHCVLEVQAWDAGHYSAEQLKGQDSNSPIPNEPAISLDLITSPAYAGHMVSLLTDDLLSKQRVLEKLQRAVLRAEGSSQLGLWRVHEAEKRNGALAADLAQMRKLLHEEKSSSKVSLYCFRFQVCEFNCMTGLATAE